MPNETQNPFENQPPSDPPLPDVGTAVPAPASDVVAEAAPIEAVQNAAPASIEPVVEAVENEAELAAEEVHSHESILTTMLTQLEGAAHMAKSEIESVIAKARSLFDAL